MPSTNKLTVYKASAGSGKTFTLAVEYIKLLIQNPEEYKFILAVTFTNKATGEMKTRILSKLFGLANYTKDADDYLAEIKKDDAIIALHLSDEQIRERCGEALHKIIHDYSRFRIETIDSFFQSIIRDLSRELNLTANLRVDLNAQEVLDEAVEKIIDEISTDKSLFNIVLQFVREKINAGGNWKIDTELSSFGKNIFKEDYLRNKDIITESIKDVKIVRQFRKDLETLNDAILEDTINVTKGIMMEMDNLNISFTDIKNGEKIVGTFLRKVLTGDIPSPSDTLVKYAGDVNEMFGKKADKNIVANFASSIHPHLKRLIKEIVPKALQIRNSVSAICKHLNHLMLLNIVNEKVRDLNSEANRFLLADSAHFLNDIIDNSDIPFVYEKSGTWFHHIMIDEFQDTSALQWENFKPLISNSLDNNDSCLIVGDVKQSIYRWRDSDWQILNKRINEEYANHINPVPLKTNFRSAGRVIHFNNQFFAKAANLLNENYKKVHGTNSVDLTIAYNDVCQAVPEKKENTGFIYIKNFEGANYTDNEPQRILDTVVQLMEEGIKDTDITILVRENRYIPILSQFFFDNKDKVNTSIVSDEAFRLDSSSAVNLIIFALTSIAHPNDGFALRNLAIHYQMAMQGDITIKNDANRFFLADDEEIKALLPEGFMENVERYSFTPLHELIEEMYEILSLKNIKGQDPYLFFFHDQINSYVQDNQTDIDTFLKCWEEKICKLTIPNASSSGIRIMSIHKSKGLQFHTVIMPYCNWGMGPKVNPAPMIWAKPNQMPYNTMPIVPLDCSSSLDESIFQNDYREELLKYNVDNLNLLYVGFTRAEKNLVVLTGKPSKGGDNIQKIILDTMKGLQTYSATDKIVDNVKVEMEEIKEGDETIWSWGTPVPSKEEEKKENDNILEKEYDDIPVSFVHEKSNVEFRQSNESSKFVTDADSTEIPTLDYKEKGLLYHKIFELLKTKDDVDAVIDQLDREGQFDSIFSADEARKNIKEALNDPIASKWFAEGWKEYKECTIMYRSKSGKVHEYRPDRVIANDDETIVIDYKSGKEEDEHKDQVSWYKYLLIRMGYKNVKGYVWYFMNNKIVEVKKEKGGDK